MITDWGRNYILTSAFGLAEVRTEWWVALLTREPNAYQDGSSLWEVAGNQYSRAYVPNSTLGWSNPVLGMITNLNQISFPQADGGDWASVGHYALVSQSSGGEILGWNSFKDTLVITEGQIARFEPEKLWFALGEVF